MSLAMIGKGASYEFRWRRWALLRDAVVTHLEDARAGSLFPQFNSIGNALGVTAIRIPASLLAQELEAIRTGLAERTIDNLVIDGPTSSVLYPNVRLAAARPLSRAELSQIAPVGDARTLDQYFSSMLDSMLEVCSHPHGDGMIEVFDG